VAFVFLASRVGYLGLSSRPIVKRSVPWTYELERGRCLAKTWPPDCHTRSCAIGTLYFQVDTLVVQHYLGSEESACTSRGPPRDGVDDRARRIVQCVSPDPCQPRSSDPSHIEQLAERMTRHLAAVVSLVWRV